MSAAIAVPQHTLSKWTSGRMIDIYTNPISNTLKSTLGPGFPLPELT